MPYNPFQMMMLEMLLGQLQQQGNPFGGAMGYGGGGFGGQQGIARGMSPTRGIPGGLGVSPFMPPPQQGGYGMQSPPQQGGYNVRRREQPALSYWGRGLSGQQQPQKMGGGGSSRPYEKRKKGQQQAPSYWGLGFSGR